MNGFRGKTISGFLSAFVFGAICTISFSELIRYEPRFETFPESQGWDRTSFCDPARWLESGCLLQSIDIEECGSIPGGQRDYYQTSLAAFESADGIFVEWRMETTGSSAELDFTAPAALIASSTGESAVHHFTISRDQIRFIRFDDGEIEFQYFSIEPLTSHCYRLEITHDMVVWFVDDEVRDVTVPVVPFPSPQSILGFCACSWTESSTTRWHYVRAGAIPMPASMDFDSDSLIAWYDHFLFADYFTGPEVAHLRGWDCSDADDDSDIDLRDFAALQNMFTGDE